MLTEAQKLLAEIEANFREYVYIPDDYSYWLASMWVAGSHLRNGVGDFMPYAYGRLGFFSKTPGCAKTLSALVAMHMCYNGDNVLDPTPPSIRMMLDLEKNTVFFDEFDRYFGRGNGNSSMRTIVDGGYLNDAKTTRRENGVVVAEDIGGPMILAGKNYQRFTQSEAFDTTRTRTFVILLEEAPEEKADELMDYDPEFTVPTLHELRRRLRTYFRSHATEILAIQPEIPRGIVGRPKQIWKPIFQLAEFVGGVWPERMRKAALAMVLGIFDTDNAPVSRPADELLDWVRAVFRDDESYLMSGEIVNRLLCLPGNLWWKIQWEGKSQRACEMSLSRNLRVNGIDVERIWTGDEQRNGYSRVSLGMPPAQDHLVVDLGE